MSPCTRRGARTAASNSSGPSNNRSATWRPGSPPLEDSCVEYASVLAPTALQLALVNGKPEGWRPRPSPTTAPGRPDWVEGSFRFDSYDAAIRELLSLGPDIEILLPAELRSAMATIGRRLALLHRRTQ